MTDFMRWLYAHYIQPEIMAGDPTGYETPLSLMDTCLDPYLREQYERAVEYYASRAFCLGFRTGQGMAGSLAAEPREPLCL